jgi:hypothetical protein
MGELAKALKKADRRILILDIENSPHVTATFDLKVKGYISPDHILKQGQVISWAAKWVGERRIYFGSDYHTGHQTHIEQAYELVDRADIVVGYNSKSFDLKHLRREWFEAGLPPSAPHKDVDLLLHMRQNFAFPSNRLNYITRRIGLGEKVDHAGMPLWFACMDIPWFHGHEGGDPRAWAKMRSYNKHDVRLTEQLYERLLPWIHNHPHVRNADVQGNELTCNKCGSDDLVRSSTYTAQVHQYQAYRCRRCGGQVRAGHIKRIAQTVGVK